MPPVIGVEILLAKSCSQPPTYHWLVLSQNLCPLQLLLVVGRRNTLTSNYALQGLRRLYPLSLGIVLDTTQIG